MEDLAHWIINVGTGALIGTAIALGIMLLVGALDETGPIRVPIVTPMWEWMRDKMDRIIRRH